MRTFAFVGLVSVATASVASGGAIGVTDILSIEVSSSTGGTWNLMDNIASVTTFQQNMDGVWIIEGTSNTGAWACDWGFEINTADAARGGFNSGSIATSFNFTNTTGNDAATFILAANAFVGALNGPTELTGQISGSLGSGNPVVEVADLYTPMGDNMYTALIDGVGVQTLLDDSFSLSTNLTAPFNSTPFLNVPGGAVASTIGIRHSFGLTNGDNANFVGVFVVNEVPGPGPAALVGIGGLAVLRRRR